MAMRLLIVGAGPAGITVAETVRRHDPAAEITLVSSEPFAPYAPPAMADYFRSGKDSILYWKGRDVCERLDIDFRSGATVTSLSPDAHTVRLAGDVTLNYDRLVIATGSGLYAPVPGYERRGVYNFKSLAAATRLVEKVRAGDIGSAVIVGAGFIGIELALLLQALGVAVTIIEREDRLMPRMLEAETAGIVLGEVRARGVEVRLETPARAFVGDDAAEGVELESGKVMRADAYIAATGVKPNIDWLAGAGIDKKWGVIVDNQLRANVADVYVAGDVAETRDRITGERYVHANFPNAIAQALVVAGGLLGYEQHYPGAESMNSLKHLGVEVIAVGAQRGEEELRQRNGNVLRKLFVSGGRIVGFRLAGNIRGAGVYRSLMLRGVDVTRFKGRLLDSRPGAAWFAGAM